MYLPEVRPPALIPNGARASRKRVSYMFNENMYRAIDPMALILSERAYLIWVEIHNPHVPKVAEIQEALRSLSAEEKTSILTRARTLSAFGRAVEEALAGGERTGVAA
jgi:hypothetical protein